MINKRFIFTQKKIVLLNTMRFVEDFMAFLIYEERYKIDKDTLYKYLYGLENKGVKVNIDIKKS